jgi:hypothetical protein
MTERRRLPNRRNSTVLEFELRGLRFTASYSCFADGAVAEIFLQNHKPSSQSDSNARDAAVAASLALLVASTATRGVARRGWLALNAARYGD